MLLLRNVRTTTHTQDDVIGHVANHATRYDITPIAHRFFAENPRDQHDIRHDFGSLVPPNGDTYFEFDLPPYIRLGLTTAARPERRSHRRGARAEVRP